MSTISKIQAEIRAEIRQMATETGTVPLWVFRQALDALNRIEQGAASGLAELGQLDAIAERAGHSQGCLRIAQVQAASASSVLGSFLPD
jgi:hypothetical protein